MEKIKKNWSNILFAIVIILLIVPQTRSPIQVFVLRTISFSPGEIDKEERTTLLDYQWNLSSLASKDINLKRSIGKVTIVNFWATWCAPCLAEMPDLQKLYDNYGDKVDFYFISNEKRITLQKFLEQKKYNIPIYIPTESSPEKLVIRSLPTTFLISKTGEIVIRKTGVANWNSGLVHELLDKLLDQ
jgi:thiol-disulfide isomerase/thioredoxin